MCWNIFELPGMKSHETAYSGSWVVTWGKMNMAKLRGAFLQILGANAHKNGYFAPLLIVKFKIQTTTLCKYVCVLRSKYYFQLWKTEEINSNYDPIWRHSWVKMLLSTMKMFSFRCISTEESIPVNHFPALWRHIHLKLLVP